ncbi:Multiple C2 domain and transmembrane region protein 16 [Cardamine amara subsp. amara]|uniref:Multiple C2 domain and transmembrane region protein 16 n=1 Tax=Cardamine amara subsp. amara TaxID=228776 RepID=A0ABD1A2K5_CARAN
MAATRKLVVEVVDAKDLTPKDGHGTSSPYVVVDYYGQRRRTRTIVRDLNPVWNETLEFSLAKRPSHQVFTDVLELDMYHDKNFGPTRRNNFLGRIRLGSDQFVGKGEEALIYYPLEKKSLFNLVQGEIGLRVYYADEKPPALKPEKAPLEPVVEEKTEEVPKEGQDESKPPPETKDGPAEVKETGEPPQPPPSENVPAEGPKQNEEASPAIQENAAVAGEDPAVPEQNPTPEAEATPKLPAEEPPQNHRDCEDIVLESEDSMSWASPPRSPLPEVTISRSVSGSIPENKNGGISGPQPLRRSVSETASYTSELSDVSTIERSTFDLVEKMHYVFVRVVKARSLPTSGSPITKISLSGTMIQSKPARKTSCFEWDQTFAFLRDSPDLSSSPILEISVWDSSAGIDTSQFLGGICFDVSEIPLRDPPDSPLAPQWYRLEGGGAHHGDLMLATWTGTQADESFPDAWKTDTAGNVTARAKVYMSSKLWYLRATVIEAQDLLPPQLTAFKEASFQLKAQLGFQVQKTKSAVTRNGAPSWNEDLLFVAAEPFSDQLVFTLEYRTSKGPVTVGMARVPLTAIERRVDDRLVAPRWFGFEDPNDEKRGNRSRVHLRLCFDGGYHVMDEAAHVCSDYRPTARQLWKPAVGIVELGIIGCKNMLPRKTVNGKGSTDAYTVAKYGTKWVRTRTVSDSLDPKWNEQYTWNVYDPCTVLTIGVFDSWGVYEIDGGKEATRQDLRIGKVRIRISTLETSKAYRNTYPLLMLVNGGVKKLGEIELAVRFVRSAPPLDFLHVYTQPLFPLMHHIKPLSLFQVEMLRNTAVKILAVNLSRSEPPLRPEIVRYMLDADSHTFSMRKVRANWIRIVNVVAGMVNVVRWVDDTRFWKNPTSTLLVHALVVMLIWFPDLIVPTLAFYLFVIGAWNYRFRSRAALPHFDPRLSLADAADREELDEEFDVVPSNRPPEMIRTRYDKLRAVGARVQTILGEVAAQGEKMQALVTWRDPRATGIFVGLCFLVALVLYLVPTKMVAMASGFYYFRHPIFRDRRPSPLLNFFRRLPSLSDRLM